MAKLHEQLKYYINKRITEDDTWKNVTVVLSGHDVPGEGEHKIMEYIRLQKSQPAYSPNLRHCLYGLDADLMMLGLVCHEPHFSLLREEVTFGRKTHSKPKTVEDVDFYLLHLSLFREYLDLEFQHLKQTIRFKYDLERVIDDYILLAYFVGNDFLPNLPNLHINDGAMDTIFAAYKTILPELDGYINENGVLNLKHCQALLNYLGEHEMDAFKREQSDTVAFSRGRQQKQPKKNKRTISGAQSKLFAQVKSFVITPRSEDFLTIDITGMKPDDLSFLITVSDELGLSYTTESEDLKDGDVLRTFIISWDEDDDDSDEESFDARKRILKKYDKASVRDKEENDENDINDNFAVSKWEYYQVIFMFCIYLYLKSIVILIRFLHCSSAMLRNLSARQRECETNC